MRYDARLPTLAAVSRFVRKRVEDRAVAAGEDDWAGWWERAARLPQLADFKERRDAFYASRKPKSTSSGEDCSVDFHIASLRHAGFLEAGIAWQHFDNYVVFGQLRK
jgi:hypothetical protein